MKHLKLINTFYNNFKLFSLGITFVALMLFWDYGAKALGILFWFKNIVFAITYYGVNQFKNKEYYYYQNLGIGKLKLWISVYLLDIFLFFVSLLILASFK